MQKLLPLSKHFFFDYVSFMHCSALNMLAKAWRLLTLVLLASMSVSAQAPAWQSLLTPTDGSGYVTAVAVDATGAVYLTGVFNGRLTFGGTTLLGAGFADIFIAKWNPSTNAFVWAKRAGGPEDDRAYGIAVSGANVYVVGSFESTSADFGTTTLRNAQPATVPFNFRSDAFVAKLVDSGSDASFVWAQQAGGPGFDIASAVVADGNTVYLAGRHGAPSATFGNIIVANNSGGTQLNTDLFVAKLTDTGSTGTFVWVREGGGLGSDYAAALAVSGSSLYVSGAFQNYAVLGTTALSAPGCTSGFVAKLTDNGSSSSSEWSQALGSSQQFNSSTATAVAVRGTSVYLAGNFDGTGTFGPISLASAGFSDAFIAKITDTGTRATVNWAQRCGGSSFDGAAALVANGTGVYVTGGFLSPSATFGATVLTNINPATTSSSGNPDIFLAHLTEAGSFAWTLQAGSTSTDNGLALATSASNVYVAGSVTTPATFGRFTLASAPLNFTRPFIASVGTTPLAAARPGFRVGGSLYPNPAHATTTVPLPAATGRTQAVLTLTNVVAQVVRTQLVALSTAPSSYQMDLANLPRGLYTLRVQSGRTTSFEKLLVE